MVKHTCCQICTRPSVLSQLSMGGCWWYHLNAHVSMGHMQLLAQQTVAAL